MKRDEWEEVLYANVKDEVEQDRLNQYVLELEGENTKLRELVEDMLDCIDIQISFERVPARWMQDEFAGRARSLGIEV